MGATNAFAPSRNAGLATQTAFSSMAPAVKPSPTSLNMVFGNRKTTAQKEEEAAKAAMYWEGEWVCADCGYIYNRVSSMNFFRPRDTMNKCRILRPASVHEQSHRFLSATYAIAYVLFP